MNVTAENVIESIDNAWSALCRQYDEVRSEDVRIALNMVGKICMKVKSEMSKKNKNVTEPQISIEEWLEWLNS